MFVSCVLGARRTCSRFPFALTAGVIFSAAYGNWLRLMSLFTGFITRQNQNIFKLINMARKTALRAHGLDFPADCAIHINEGRRPQ